MQQSCLVCGALPQHVALCEKAVYPLFAFKAVSRCRKGCWPCRCLMVCCGGGRAAGDGCVEVHRQRAVAGNTRLLLWCRCWYRGTHVGAVVVLCIRSEEAAARCDLAVCVSLHVWSAGDYIGNEGCASVCTALEQNKTLTSFTLGGMLCSGVCSVQVIGVLWCKCSGAVITGRSFSRLPFGSGYCGLHYGILHCGSCLPHTPPPPKRPHTGCARPKGGLCDCLHAFALTKQQKEDAHVQYAGEHDAMCV